MLGRSAACVVDDERIPLQQPLKWIACVVISYVYRLAQERADHAALMKALEEDPELRKEHQKKKLLQKEALEAAKTKKKKSGKKSKKKSGGSKKGGNSKGLSEKEQAIHDKKEAEKKAKQEAALRDERDKVRE